ncbi:helix-turn-helix domain-containing protein [Streptomyces sp. NPDC088801]|uniref:helix-turn-helix domain-containing protein n=1 Tax=Streptomyces sp. NPDC088801 TaxID=3365903 RepID=UPI003817B978
MRNKVSVWDRQTWSAIREVKGVTYRQIAEACDVYEGTPEKWFNGERNPKLKYQVAIAKVLGIPLRTVLSAIKDPGVRAAIRAAYNN